MALVFCKNIEYVIWKSLSPTSDSSLDFCLLEIFDEVNKISIYVSYCKKNQKKKNYHLCNIFFLLQNTLSLYEKHISHSEHCNWEQASHYRLLTYYSSSTFKEETNEMNEHNFQSVKKLVSVLYRDLQQPEYIRNETILLVNVFQHHQICYCSC